MGHLPTNEPVHRYVADPLELRITVEGLQPGQVAVATWICGPVSKTLGDGITVDDEGGTAVLVVDITSGDTQQLGPGVREWQAAAGAEPPPVVAAGPLRLSPRQVIAS